jgi:hypothetical protein
VVEGELSVHGTITRAQLHLYGPFRLTNLSGVSVSVSSRKAQAILAILARTPGGVRSRSKLIELLWDRHDPEPAMNGLRRELSQLRRQLADAGLAIVGADQDRIWMALDCVELVPPAGDFEFLEGIDIAGEEYFEDWLRLERAAPPPARPASPLPLPPAFADRPALAIMPIEPMGDDPNVRWLAEGLDQTSV